MNKKVTSFVDLIVWQKSHQLVLFIYEITKNFPKHEQFGLTSQIRRAVVSIACNIVEGFHRRSRPDSLRFYNIAESSLEETRCLVMIGRDLAYIKSEEYEKVTLLTNSVGALLYRWMQSFK